MSTVFMTGTEYIREINQETKTRIDNIIKLGFKILVGNYKGFDLLALKYLKGLKYPHVTVFETGSGISFGYELINAGKYPKQDIYMSENSDYILAIYDNKSKGVLKNIQRKPISKVRIVQV